MDRYALFSWMSALVALFNFSPLPRLVPLYAEEPVLVPLRVALVGAALWLLAWPRRTLPLLVLAALQLSEIGYRMPVVSNHSLLWLFVNAAVLLSALRVGIRGRSLPRDPGALYAHFAPAGRVLLLVLYFYGTFHKLNGAYLDPGVSCAVALWRLYPLPFGLAEARWAHHAAIYGSLAVEAAILGLLCAPRLRHPAILLGIAFHGFLALTEYEYVVGFSAACFALHFLFLPPETLERARSSALWRRAGGPRPALAAAVIALAAYAVLGVGWGGEPWGPGRRAAFGLLSVGVAGFALAFGRGGAQPGWRRSFVAPGLAPNLVAALFLLNGASPYLGLKTESAMAMFSNLRTEGGETNHLVVRRPPYLFGFLEDTVEILRSSSPTLRYLREQRLGMVYFSLRRFVREHPDTAVVYRRGGRVQGVERAGDVPELVAPPPLWQRAWLYFKMVDLERPVRCAH